MAVAIGADEVLRLAHMRYSLVESSYHLRRRNIVGVVATGAAFFDLAAGKHDVRRSGVVFVVAMGIRLPVTVHAAHVVIGVLATSSSVR